VTPWAAVDSSVAVNVAVSTANTRLDGPHPITMIDDVVAATFAMFVTPDPGRPIVVTDPVTGLMRNSDAVLMFVVHA
jgi:hypothetical protein